MRGAVDRRIAGSAIFPIFGISCIGGRQFFTFFDVPNRNEIIVFIASEIWRRRIVDVPRRRQLIEIWNDTAKPIL